MEDRLIGRTKLSVPGVLQKGLNPCFNGRQTDRLMAYHIYEGIYIVLILVLMEDRLIGNIHINVQIS